jgi:hypothetical protein
MVPSERRRDRVVNPAKETHVMSEQRAPLERDEPRHMIRDVARFTSLGTSIMAAAVGVLALLGVVLGIVLS